MSATSRRLAFAGTVTGLLAVVQPCIAMAEPPLPPPWLPGAPYHYPGAYSYLPHIQPVGPPETTDTRGVRTGTNAELVESSAGLPGSRLGASPGRPNALTGSSARFGITAGVTPPEATNVGANVGAGGESIALEDPSGQPPIGLAGPEAFAPTTPGFGLWTPAPILEDPYGQPPQGPAADQQIVLPPDSSTLGGPTY